MYSTDMQYVQEDLFIDVLEHTRIELLPRFIKTVQSGVAEESFTRPPVQPDKMLRDAAEAALSKVASLYLAGFSREEVVAAIAAEREEDSRRESMLRQAQQEAWSKANQVLLSSSAQRLARSIENQALAKIQAQAARGKLVIGPGVPFNVQTRDEFVPALAGFNKVLGKKYK